MPTSTFASSRLPSEDRYLAVLQAIARGHPHGGKPLPGTTVQAMVRKVLAEVGQDWTKRGAPVSSETAGV